MHNLEHVSAFRGIERDYLFAVFLNFPIDFYVCYHALSVAAIGPLTHVTVLIVH